MEVMNPERWERLQEIYHAALPMERSERRHYLAQACADDEELRREVESLLAADEKAADDFLQNGVATLGLRLLADKEPRRTEMISEKQKLDGRYEILGDLGAGGMGNVYKARDTHVTHRLVVVKVLKEEWLKNEYVVTKFKQEAVAIAKIDDPGVVGILDAGALPNGQPWLVMQYVEGSELTQPIREAPGGMDFAEVAEIIKQAGRTLTAAHHAGVIHRDLKPGNIMVRRNNSGDLQVKVIDFGIAKVKDSALGPTPPTQFQVGTPLYMSPEQINVQEVTPASDVYALGVIAYQMLTGKLPFNPKDRAELPTLQKNGVKVKPSALRAGLSEAADRAILRALSYETGKRQQSAREFGDELDRVLMTDTLPSPQRQSLGKLRMAIAAIVTMLVISGLLWMKPSSLQFNSGVNFKPERTLTYWLSIRKQGKLLRATGREIFATGDSYQFSAQAPQAGALYLFNEGTSGKWHILFPTPANSRLNPHLTAWQTLETEGYEFTGPGGTEKIWLVWATQPIPLLDGIVKQAADNSLVVGETSQQAALRQFVQERGPPPEVILDKDQLQTTLKERNDILIHLLELKHK